MALRRGRAVGQGVGRPAVEVGRQVAEQVPVQVRAVWTAETAVEAEWELGSTEGADSRLKQENNMIQFFV